jgi:hypothetical protein
MSSNISLFICPVCDESVEEHKLRQHAWTSHKKRQLNYVEVISAAAKRGGTAPRKI